MSRISLYLLGPPHIERDGQTVKLDTRKAVALLAYLAVTGEGHSRDALVNLLWPDYDSVNGRATLRRTLSSLRAALVEDWVDADRETIRLLPGLPVDVDEFHRHLALCLTHGHEPSAVCPACLAPLTEAVALYRGDFLAGFSLKDSFNFDDWQFFQTDLLRGECAGALARLSEGRRAQGDYEAAIGLARRWLALDRLDEEAHYQLMRLYAEAGRRPAALRQYQECVRILESQVGVAPQPSTTALYREIVAGQRHPVGPARRMAFAASAAAMDGPTADTAGEMAAGPATGPDAEGALAGWDEAQTAARLAALALDAAAALPPSAPAGQGENWLAVLCLRWTSPAEPGSTALPAVLQATIAGLLSEHGGRLQNDSSEGLSAVFGDERAQEQAPEMAVRAALEILRAAAQAGLTLAAGVDTRLGGEPDGAAGLAAAASPGEISVGERVYHLTRRAFAYTPAGGGQTGAPVFRVGGERPGPQRVLGVEGLHSVLIGRDAEMSRLRAALAEAVAGSGQMVSIIGEAGTGKSRLAAELQEAGLDATAGSAVPLWLEGRCFESASATSYGPFVDVLRSYFGFGARDSESRRRARVVAGLKDLALSGVLAEERLPQMTAALASLLALPSGDAAADLLAEATPAELRSATLAALADFLLALARRQPLVLILEDLHWADDLSFDLLALLMEDLARARLLLLCLYRPQGEGRCRHLGALAAQKCGRHYAELLLRELTYDESRRLVESLLGFSGDELDRAEPILSRAEGNPYIEELVRALVESGRLYRGDHGWQMRSESGSPAVPDLVQSLIRGRLANLEGEWRQALQVAATIGRVFGRRVLAGALGEASIERLLWELEERALIYQERVLPEVEYSFKHVLLQEAVYDGIPGKRRADYHSSVAAAIEDLYRDHLEEHCEQLAYHHERAGDAVRAVEYLFHAGEKAVRAYANQAAISHLTRALALLAGLPPTAERDRFELRLLLALGTPFVHTVGHAAQEVERTYARANELCHTAGDRSQTFLAVLGLRRYYLMRGQLSTALALAESLASLSEGDDCRLARVHMMQSETLYWLGRFAEAGDQAAAGRVLCVPGQRRSEALVYGNDTGIGCRIFEVLPLWHLGYPDRALANLQELLVAADSLGHPFTLVFAHQWAAMLRWLRGEFADAARHAETVLHISGERGFGMYRAWATIWLGASRKHEPVAGLELIERGNAAWQEMGGEMSLAATYALWAGALWRLGRPADGLAAVGAGLAAVATYQERCWESELYRLTGELWLQAEAEAQALGRTHVPLPLAPGLPPAAEQCFQKALAVAREQRARSWELRAATSLARLWHGQGRMAEARALLGPVYASFGEGSATADLQAARALLEQLG